MRKYITFLLTMLLLFATSVSAQRTSGLSGTGLDGFIEQTTFDSIHVAAGKFIYGAAGSGQDVTATGVELNYLDISVLGTGAASKAVVLDSGDDYTWPATGVFTYSSLHDGTTLLTSTVAQLNAIPATTSSAAELNYLDIAALGTGVNTKAVVLDAGGDYTWEAAGVLTYAVLHDGTTALTSTALELNVLDGISAGLTSAELDILDGVTSTASELNLLDGVLSTTAEIDQRALTVKMIDVSSAGQVHVVSPYTGNVTAVYSVLNATIATADAGITIKDKDGNTMGTITITFGGSGPGDVDSDVSIANADVVAGDMIEIETDNASTNAVEVEFTILIAIQ